VRAGHVRAGTRKEIGKRRTPDGVVHRMMSVDNRRGTPVEFSLLCRMPRSGTWRVADDVPVTCIACFVAPEVT